MASRKSRTRLRRGGATWFRHLFQAADEHAAASGSTDYAFDDLQQLLVAAISVMDYATLTRFFNDPCVRDLAQIPEYQGLLEPLPDVGT